MKRILCPLKETAQKFPSQPALFIGNKPVSYHILDSFVEDIKSNLTEIGIKPNDRVAILSGRDYLPILTLFALWRMKSVACPLSTWIPREAVLKRLNDLKCSHLLIDSDLAPRLGDTSCQTHYFEDLIGKNHAPPGDCPLKKEKLSPFINLNQEATILWTSGSSAKPKAVVHTFGNHYFNAKGSNENISIEPSDRWLLLLPLYHVSGISILFRCFLGGGAVVIPGEEETLTDTITNYKVTHVSLVATQLYRLLKNENNIEMLQKMKAILLGGGPIPTSLLNSAQEAQLPVYITYGLTEAASQIATSSSAISHSPYAKVLPYRQVKISEEGEILVKGDVLFKGYLKDGKISYPVDESGWFATGDMGTLKDNNLSVTGRKDNMFISGGENISPEEIELTLLNIEGIAQAIVVPLADEEFGARPVAFLEIDNGKTLSAKEVKTTLAKILPAFKIPRKFYTYPDEHPCTEFKVNRQWYTNLIKNHVEAFDEIA